MPPDYNDEDKTQDLNSLLQQSNFDYLPFNTIDYNSFNPESENLDFEYPLFQDHKSEKCANNYQNDQFPKKIMDKLNSFENNYFNKVVVEKNYYHDKGKEASFASNLMIAEKTLPGTIISYMYHRGEFLSESEILENVAPKFDTLRKTNGSCYQGDKTKTLRSALSSSGVFERNNYGLWFYKEKEAINYVIKINEQVLTKKLEKEKKVDMKNKSIKTTDTQKSYKSSLSTFSNNSNISIGNGSNAPYPYPPSFSHSNSNSNSFSCSTSTNTNTNLNNSNVNNIKQTAVKDNIKGAKVQSKKTKKRLGKIKNAFGDVNFKIKKVYNILDDLLGKYRSVNTTETQFNPFDDIHSSLDILQKIGDENICVGILMCFKFFKSLMGKYFKMSKKKKLEMDLGKKYDKFIKLSQRIDYIEKYVQFDKTQVHL